MWWDGYGHGSPGPLMWISMVGFWLILFGLVIWMVVALTRRDESPPRESGQPDASGPDPERILRERFARGEIDEEEFERRRELLRR